MDDKEKAHAIANFYFICDELGIKEIVEY